MTQTLLWDVIESKPEPMPPHVARDTSRAAAESVRDQVTRLRATILETIRAAGDRGMTCDEIEVATGFLHQTASPRQIELARQGHIVEARNADGKAITRPTRSGRKAMVWIAKEFAETSEKQGDVT